MILIGLSGTSLLTFLLTWWKKWDRSSPKNPTNSSKMEHLLVFDLITLNLKNIWIRQCIWAIIRSYYSFMLDIKCLNHIEDFMKFILKLSLSRKNHKFKTILLVIISKLFETMYISIFLNIILPKRMHIPQYSFRIN